MGIIINPRGIGGSGKTELVRTIMQDYGWSGCSFTASSEKVTPIFRRGRRFPIGYRLAHPFDHRPLVVVGQYERRSGGCDTIRERDGGLAEVFRMSVDHVERGHDVLIEGRRLSYEIGGSVRLAQLTPSHVIHLDTPVAVSARNLVRRHRARTDGLSLLVSEAKAEHERVAAACERLRAHADVHRLDFDRSLAKARDLLRLAEEGQPSIGGHRNAVGRAVRPIDQTAHSGTASNTYCSTETIDVGLG